MFSMIVAAELGDGWIKMSCGQFKANSIIGIFDEKDLGLGHNET